MPKRVKTINQFHGGLNSFSDPRDAVENQLTEANDLMVDELGKTRVFGSYASVTNGIIPKGAADVVPGYGLFHFSHDYPGLGSTYSSGKGLASQSSISSVYTILGSAESGSQKFYIYSHPELSNIGVELMPNQVDRDFSGASAWENDNLDGTYNEVDDLTMVGGVVGQYAKLPVASAPTTIGLSYILYYDVSGLANSEWDIKSFDGTQTMGTITEEEQQGSIEFIATTTGGLRLVVSKLGAGASGFGTFDNFSLKEGGWSQPFTLGSSGDFRMLPYNVDGQLRITESNFNNTQIPKWFGYLIRDYFSSNELYDGWYTDNSTYTLPTLSTIDSGASNQSGSFNFVNASSTENMPDGCIQLEFIENATGSWKFDTGSAEKYVFYISYIYDGGYDSGLIQLATSDDDLQYSLDEDNKGITLQITIAPSGTGTNSDWFTHHSPRILGFRLYYVKLITTLEQASAPYCITESYFDKNKGTRLPLSNAWEEWTTVTHNGTAGCQRAELLVLDPPSTITYEDINGFSEKDITSAQFKTICIVNRKAYIGNIKQDGKVNGDMMIKSPVNGFDLFPESRSIEVSVRDGDDIIKFEEYADRILQFKRQKMHLINISQEIEFLEDTYMHKGIDYPSAACKTDFGIVWANKHGCYFYDGKQVSNLLEKQGRKIISDSDWQTHTENHIAIVYLPKHRQLMVINDLGVAGNKNVYLYDMVTASWVTSTQAMYSSSNETLTNIITDFHGDLMWGYKTTNVNFIKWDNSSSYSKTDFALKTKSMSFGSPAQRKNIYNVQISYQGDGTAIVPSYGLNGDTTPNNSFTAGALGNGGTSDWTHLKLVPSTSVNNAQSFRLQFAGTAASDFAINDITVVYRLKSVK